MFIKSVVYNVYNVIMFKNGRSLSQHIKYTMMLKIYSTIFHVTVIITRNIEHYYFIIFLN